MKLKKYLRLNVCNPIGVDWKKELFPKEGWKNQEEENSIGIGIEKGIAGKEPMNRAQFSFLNLSEIEVFLLKNLKIHDIRWSKMYDWNKVG